MSSTVQFCLSSYLDLLTWTSTCLPEESFTTLLSLWLNKLRRGKTDFITSKLCVSFNGIFCILIVRVSYFTVMNVFFVPFCVHLEGLLIADLCTVCGAKSHRTSWLYTWPGSVWKTVHQKKERLRCRRPRIPPRIGPGAGIGITTVSVRCCPTWNVVQPWWRSFLGGSTSSEIYPLRPWS